MKKIIAVALSVTLGISIIISGCSSTKNTKNNSTNTNAQNSNLTEKGTYPIVKNQVTLKVMAQVSPDLMDLDTNKITKWYQDKTNIKVEWQRITGAQADWDTKVNIMLASATDLPDVFVTSSTVGLGSRMNKYGSEGIFLALNDYIDKWGVNIKKIYAYDPLVESSIKELSGKIYGLPTYAETYHTTYMQKAWINQKWLNKLSLKTPETTDELIQVLKAFKEKDPNGNGKADEVALTCVTGANQSDVTGFLMNPFTFSTSSAVEYFDKGKVVAAYNQPEWRDGLRYINKLYVDGLMDKEFLTTNPTLVKQLVEAKEGNRLGMAISQAPQNFCDMTDASNRKEDFVSLAPLKGPKGLRQTPYYYTQPKGGVFVITKECKNPEAAFRWADGMYDSGTDPQWLGEENVDWAKAKPGEVGIDGKQATINGLVKPSTPQNSWWGGNFGPSFQLQSERNGRKVVIPGKYEAEKVLYDETKKNYEPYRNKDTMTLPVLKYQDTDTEFRMSARPAIVEYVRDATARFTTGYSSLDKDWDSYIKGFDKLELSKYLKQTQDAYDSQYKNIVK